MPPLQLADLPEGIPIPYRSAEAPDGLDLNSLLIAHPLSTFYMRVRGHRLRRCGVLDGDLLLIDRSIEPQPDHLVVVAHGERFLLRPLEVEGENWRLAALSPGEVPLPLDPGDLETSGLFGVGVAVVHHFVPSPRASQVPRANGPYLEFGNRRLSKSGIRKGQCFVFCDDDMFAANPRNRNKHVLIYCCELDFVRRSGKPMMNVSKSTF